MKRVHLAKGQQCLRRALLLVLILASPAVAQTPEEARDRAKRIHDRLAGVPPTNTILSSMAGQILASNPVGAAQQAMNNPAFYTSVLKNFVTPSTNEARTVFAELNDYTATVIGMIRDNVPFDQVLTADMVYVGGNGVVGAAFSHVNNDHYRQLEEQGIDLSDPTQLVQRLQSTLPGSQLAASETAGVLTTRAAAEAFFQAGTNRRMWRFTAINYLCRDMEELHDITRPADRIRQDVSRSPGGDSSLFMNFCIGCHNGMDPMAQAFAFFQYDEGQERLVHTRGVVQPKYFINAETFTGGYRTPDNRWDNFWRNGPNAVLGWDPSLPGSGFGAKSLGEEVTHSRAFAQCQVEKVFEQVCFHPPADLDDRLEVERIADVFEQNNHNMKQVFAEVAAYCTAP